MRKNIEISDEKINEFLEQFYSYFESGYAFEEFLKVYLEKIGFVRTYAEMHMVLHETKYIPNLDDLGLDDKKAILSDIYQIDLSDKDERFVEMQFHRIMKREIRDIEKDIENIS